MAGYELRIMTLNVWSGLDYRGILRMGELETPSQRRARYEALVGEIRRLRPDVVGINEANPLPGYVLQLARDTGYRAIWSVALSGIRCCGFGIPLNLREGDAILAARDLGLERLGRAKLAGKGYVGRRLSFHTDNVTQVLVGGIKTPVGDCFLAVTHLRDDPVDDEWARQALDRLTAQWGVSGTGYRKALRGLKRQGRIRRREIGRLLSYLSRVLPEDRPCVLMGDLNAEPDSPLVSMVLEAGFQDTYRKANEDPGYTWDPELNFLIRRHHLPRKQLTDAIQGLRACLNARRRRIDYIFIRGPEAAYRVLSSGLCANEPRRGILPSDHFGVITTLRFP